MNDNLGIFPRLLRQDVEFIKLDYQLNQANRLSGAVNVRDWKQPNGTAFASTNNSGLLAQNSPAFLQNRFIIATWNALIGNDKVNEFRYQWGIDQSFTGTAAAPPQVTLTNMFAYGLQGPTPSFNRETRQQFSDNFSFTKTTHSFKASVDINYIHEKPRVSNFSSATPLRFWYPDRVVPPAALDSFFATGSLTCITSLMLPVLLIIRADIGPRSRKTRI